MPLKGFVDEARKTNRIMEQQKVAMQERGPNYENILDLSDGQRVSPEKLEKIKSDFSGAVGVKGNNQNYTKVIGKTDDSQIIYGKSGNNANGKDDFVQQKYNLNADNESDSQIISPKDAQNPYTDFEKEYMTKKKLTPETQVSTEIKLGNGTGLGSVNKGKQIVDDRHGNIIADVIRSSGGSGERAAWQECRHLKTDGASLYCREFMSLCAKDKCPRACK